ncbi:flocculation protein FLO11 isoform X2 [Nematostella vectensis]|uniref:flocculation protein FLO11 isoform X2 n=1 Tax=Nematostella vectensis TaxID=45351 RepID=UPI00207778A9|nr:flocculation protein FLO11 isoform X2 [Nematostella vectensis]
MLCWFSLIVSLLSFRLFSAANFEVVRQFASNGDIDADSFTNPLGCNQASGCSRPNSNGIANQAYCENGDCCKCKCLNDYSTYVFHMQECIKNSEINKLSWTGTSYSISDINSPLAVLDLINTTGKQRFETSTQLNCSSPSVSKWEYLDQGAWKAVLGSPFSVDYKQVAGGRKELTFLKWESTLHVRYAGRILRISFACDSTPLEKMLVKVNGTLTIISPITSVTATNAVLQPSPIPSNTLTPLVSSTATEVASSPFSSPSPLSSSSSSSSSPVAPLPSSEATSTSSSKASPTPSHISPSKTSTVSEAEATSPSQPPSTAKSVLPHPTTPPLSTPNPSQEAGGFDARSTGARGSSLYLVIFGGVMVAIACVIGYLYCKHKRKKTSSPKQTNGASFTSASPLETYDESLYEELPEYQDPALDPAFAHFDNLGYEKVVKENRRSALDPLPPVPGIYQQAPATLLYQPLNKATRSSTGAPSEEDYLHPVDSTRTKQSAVLKLDPPQNSDYDNSPTESQDHDNPIGGKSPVGYPHTVVPESPVEEDKPNKPEVPAKIYDGHDYDNPLGVKSPMEEKSPIGSKNEIPDNGNTPIGKYDAPNVLYLAPNGPIDPLYHVLEAEETNF